MVFLEDEVIGKASFVSRFDSTVTSHCKTPEEVYLFQIVFFSGEGDEPKGKID